MTQDEIISMAREAGIGALTDYGKEALARFAALVAVHERKACAKVCEEYDMDHIVGQQLAEAIRARGENER